MNGRARVGTAAIATLLAVAAISLGLGLRSLAVDDAFVTYRYAHNLAAGNGFTYNPDRPILSTSAPLYALLLAAGTWLSPDLPVLANTLSAAALFAGALFLFVLGYRERTPLVGALAALLFALYPLLWLSLGLETAVFLALSLAAIVTYRGGRLYWTAVLLALATLTRGDGLILTAIVAADYFLSWAASSKFFQAWKLSNSGSQSTTWRIPLGALAVYIAAMLPVLAWLTWQFGSPLPVTLGTKVAQSELGVTGFYTHTTFLQGLGILARARLAQSPLYALFVPAALLGLVAMRWRARWVRIVVAWGAAHLLGYTLLGVTPYYWYYAPLVPGLLSAVALGVVDSARWLAQHKIKQTVAWGLGGLWAAILLLILFRSNWAMMQGLDGPVPPPDNPMSKVLPEAKGDIYEQAGRWLDDHTPTDATVGVTEVGIIGYYARRPMIDFLGLLEPKVAEALARGDLYWALLRYQPDYLALTGVSPLYAFDLRADPWFQAAYTPVQSFEDPRFWGSPLTVYQRRVDRMPLVEPGAGGLPEGATRVDVDFDGKIRLLGAVASQNAVRPGDVLALTLYWEALGSVEEDYTVFVHLLGQHDRVIAQRDAPPGLGARPTSRWTSGQMVADPYLLALPEAAYTPDQAVWEVGLYDAQTGRRLPTSGGGDNVRFAAISVSPSQKPLDLDFGPVALSGYDLDRLALTPGEALQVTLHWTGNETVQVIVQLVSEGGDVAARAGGSLDQAIYTLIPEAGIPPGAYDLELLAVDPVTGATLPLLGTDGQPRGDRARLTKVRLYP